MTNNMNLKAMLAATDVALLPLDVRSRELHATLRAVVVVGCGGGAGEDPRPTYVHFKPALKTGYEARP